MMLTEFSTNSVGLIAYREDSHVDEVCVDTIKPFGEKYKL
jgi:hypothetical protein